MKKKRFPGMMDLLNIMFNPKFLSLAMTSVEGLFRLANLPIIRNFHPWTDPDKTNMYWIPVNKTLEREEDVVLPYQVVEELIDKSSHRVVINVCGCRAGCQCEDFSFEIGCLMMGEDTKKISPYLSRSVTKSEAKKHLKKAVKAGLPPFVGKARVDNFLFGDSG